MPARSIKGELPSRIQELQARFSALNQHVALGSPCETVQQSALARKGKKGNRSCVRTFYQEQGRAREHGWEQGWHEGKVGEKGWKNKNCRAVRGVGTRKGRKEEQDGNRN